MNKLYIIFGIFLFIFFTILVLCTDSNSMAGKVNLFSANPKIALKDAYNLKNSSTNTEFSDININSDNKLKNKNAFFNNSNSNISNNKAVINDSNINLNNKKTDTRHYPSINSPDIYRKNAYVNFNNKSNINTQQSEVNEENFALKDIYLHPEDMKKIQNAGLKDINNISTADLKNIEALLNQPEDEKYTLEDIDWNTWKSRLINKITTDSGYIKDLDYYPLDTPLYYSFNVHNDGRISDVLVISLVVVESDRKKLANLIKSYEHKPIVKFPKGSKRKKVSLSSIMLLSNESKLSKPGDFNDIEKIKVKL